MIQRQEGDCILLDTRVTTHNAKTHTQNGADETKKEAGNDTIRAKGMLQNVFSMRRAA